MGMEKPGTTCNPDLKLIAKRIPGLIKKVLSVADKPLTGKVSTLVPAVSNIRLKFSLTR